MKKILRVTSVLGIATIVSLCAGLVRAKFLAWQLGPSGLGIIAQAMMFSAFAMQFCSLNIGTGITKEISEGLAQKDDGRVKKTVNTSVALQFIAGGLLIAVVLLFSRSLTTLVFSDIKYRIYLIGMAVTAPLAVFMTGTAYPLFYGFKKIAECSKLAITNTLIGLGLVISLVWFYRIDGMLAQIILIAVISFAGSYYFVRKNTPVNPVPDAGLFKDKECRGISSRLFGYGLISFIPANINMLVMLYLRGIFMKQYGVEANGYFQVGFAMSAYYLPFVTNSVWGHFYPEMCAMKENTNINREINQFIRFTVLAATAIAAGCVIFRKYIIFVLFSGQFMKAYDLLAVQAVGDIFFIIYYVFAASLTARRKFRDIIISMAAYNGILLGLYYVLTHFGAYDLLTLNIAIAVSNFILAVAAFIYWRFDTGFTLSSINTGLFIKSALLVAMILLIPDKNILVTGLKIALAAAWALVSVTRDEASGLRALILSKLKRNTIGENGR